MYDILWEEIEACETSADVQDVWDKYREYRVFLTEEQADEIGRAITNLRYAIRF